MKSSSSFSSSNSSSCSRHSPPDCVYYSTYKLAKHSNNGPGNRPRTGPEYHRRPTQPITVNLAFENENDETDLTVVRTHPQYSEASTQVSLKSLSTASSGYYDAPPSEKIIIEETKNIGHKNVKVVEILEPPDENAIKKAEKRAKKELQQPVPIIGRSGLFKFATKKEVLYIILGTISAIIHGAGFPVILIFYGDMTNDFINYSYCEEYTNVLFVDPPSAPPNVAFEANMCYEKFVPKGLEYVDCSSDQITAATHLYDCYFAAGVHNSTTYSPQEPWSLSSYPPSQNVEGQIGRYAVIFVIIGVVCMIAAYFQILFYTISSAGQAREIRILFFRSVVNQEIGWFDLNTVGELNAKISEDISKIANGIGDKFSILIQKMSCFIIGFIVAYIIGWELALIITAIIPLIIVGGFFFGKFVAGMTTKELKAYASASSISQEVIDGIRVVTAFEGQDRETNRYDESLEQAEAQGIRKGLVQGFFTGYIWLVVFITFGASFYIGANVLNYEPGRLITVFFCILIGSINLSQASPNLEAVSIARTAANPIYKIIARKSKIDPSDRSGRKLKNVRGDIEFKNVSFNYPSRPDLEILKNCSFKCTAGQISALCGPSGMGKSTIVQLILRYYDPNHGVILLDGVDIRELDVAWLRSLIAVVEQEPMMLNLTVMENIRFGNKQASDAAVYLAAKRANCYDFIMDLPQGFETELTSGGGGLSGGQKQRVAVARALIRDAKILLLDQATSALDTHSEKLVINEINRRTKGTTLIIAHRLSTIRAAHVIFGIEHGTIVEAGDHNALIAKKGVYFTLVTLQGGDTSIKKEEKKEPKLIEIEESDEEDELTPGLSRKESKRFRESTRSRALSTVKQQLPVVMPSKITSNEPYDPLSNEAKIEQKGVVGRILGYNSPETCYMIFGSLAAAINGGIMPFFSIIFSNILKVLGEQGSEKSEGVLDWSLGFVAIGVVSFFTQFLQTACFAVSGERLTRRLRRISFHSILGQDMTWFDSPKNSPSVLVGSLATDCAQVQGAAGQSVGAMVQAIAAITVGFVIAFAFGWMLALVVLVFFPLIIITGIINGRIWSGTASKDRVALADAGKVVSECLENIRMVAAYGQENAFDNDYVKEVQRPYDMAIQSVNQNAIFYSLSQVIIFYAYGAAFGYGGYLVEVDVLPYYYVFRVFSAIIFAGQAVGRAMAFAPDFAKAQIAADSVFNIIDRNATYADPYSEEGVKVDTNTAKGDIKLQQIDFRYPSRPDTQVLFKLNLHIPAGFTVAFVGQSGCGKSTSMQILQRFYDPEGGLCKVDGVATVDQNTRNLRRLIGIVAQDPILLGTSPVDLDFQGFEKFRTKI